MAAVEVVADHGDLCGEAPLWDVAAGALYWSDCVGNKFYRLGQGTILTGFTVNGAALHRDGGFVFSNLDGVWRWPGAGAPTRLQAGRFNDCIADARGRVLAGTFFYDPAGPYPLGQLVSIGHGVLDDGFHLANGLGFSPDQRTLYFADSAARVIYAYDYDLATGRAKNRREFVRVPATDGLPDGLTVDSDGFVWSAQWYGGCVVRYDPDGREERRLAIPAKQISSVMFGGRDLNELYITSAGLSEPMPLMPPGYDPQQGHFGGPLYRVRLDIRGLPEHSAA